MFICEADSMSEIATYKFDVEGIDCADCAAKLEEKIKQIKGISNVSLSFMHSSLVYDCDHDKGKEIEEEIRTLIQKEEPEAVMTSKGHIHHHEEHHHEHCEHEHCECHHEHNHEQEEMATYLFEVVGFDCADCAARVEHKLQELEGISNVSISFINNKLTYDCDHDLGKEMEEKVRAIIQKEEPEVVMIAKGHKHHHEEHHEHHEEKIIETKNTRKYKIEGLDCANCAAKLEGQLSKIQGVSNVHVSYINSSLTYDCEEKDLERIEKEMVEITAKEEPEAKISSYQSIIKKEIKTKEEDHDKKMLMRLIIGAILFLVSLFLEGFAQVIISLISYLILGYDVILKAFKGIGRGQVFDEHFLMTIATFAAIYLQDYKEAAGVMLFYQIGEYFQDLAVRRSRRSIGELMDIRPDFAVVKRNDTYHTVSPEEVEVDEIILVKPGERIPLDGIIISGSSSLDTASLTGESKLRDVDVNDEVSSGAINKSGVLEIKVTKPYGESTVARILDLVENQETKKSSQENFITKFSRVYTPTVVVAAIVVAIIVSLLGLGLEEGIRRACTFLVISCPCALVISIPLSFFAGIGGLSSRGVLVKGANLIEPLANINHIVLDKTGTLTSGTFKVKEVLTDKDPKEVLNYASIAEYYSNHPIAISIKEASTFEVDESKLHEINEIAGRGMEVTYENEVIYAGNYKLMKEKGIACKEENVPGTLVYVAKNKEYLGCILLGDELKEDAYKAIEQLHQEGKKCVLISGDNQELTEQIANELKMDEYHGECFPEDKVHYVEELKKQGLVGFVGDGVNDAPVITCADVGFAMGALGSDAAIEAADVVLMDDAPSKISLAISSAKRILKVANQNIYGAILIKVLVLILGAFGIANMWMAIFADTGVAMLCVLNSLRLLHIARK